MAIAAKNSIPIQCRATSADVFSFNESMTKPTESSMAITPVAIPMMSGVLLFFPNMPLWAKQVNGFGPGVNNAMPITPNN
jgi:hypothetical protein